MLRLTDIADTYIFTYDGGTGGGSGRAAGSTRGRKSGGGKAGKRGGKNRKAGKTSRGAKTTKRGRGRPRNNEGTRGIAKVRKSPMGDFPNLTKGITNRVRKNNLNRIAARKTSTMRRGKRGSRG